MEHVPVWVPGGVPGVNTRVNKLFRVPSQQQAQQARQQVSFTLW